MNQNNEFEIALKYDIKRQCIVYKKLPDLENFKFDQSNSDSQPKISADPTELPLKILNRVIGKKSVLVLDNAMEAAEFYDETIIANEIKSVACIPIRNQHSFIGIVYLENNLSTAAFDDRKITMILLISALCVPSFENVLYMNSLQKLKESLEEKVVERTKNLEIEQKKRIEESYAYRKKLENFISKICHEIRFF